MKAIFPTFGILTMALAIAANGCKAEASAKLGGGEAKQPEPAKTAEPAPTPAPTPVAPPPDPPPKPKLVSVGKAKIEGTKINMPDAVHFTSGSAKIDEAKSKDALDTLLAVLQQNANVTKLRIEGHTDDVGNKTFNKDLSDKRAAAVVAWLIAKGINKDRLKSVGYGMERPLAPNTNDANRAGNRRTEFHVEEIDGKPAEESGGSGGGTPAPAGTGATGGGTPAPAGSGTPKK